MINSELLTKYLDEHAHSLDPFLDEVERKTYLNTLQPHMLSGKSQAIFLKMIGQLCNAKKILEIGTFTGFTALAFAEAVGPNGSVITIECDEEIAEIARENFSKSPFGSRIEMIVGDAKKLLIDLMEHEEIPDLVFIDADKESNALYYNVSIEKMKSGGVVLVDNILWKGRVLDDNSSDKKTNSIKAFNDMVRNDYRVDACIMPLRDGIYMIRKK